LEDSARGQKKREGEERLIRIMIRVVESRRGLSDERWRWSCVWNDEFTTR